jgi:hypothetical protein
MDSYIETLQKMMEGVYRKPMQECKEANKDQGQPTVEMMLFGIAMNALKALMEAYRPNDFCTQQEHNQAANDALDTVFKEFDTIIYPQYLRDKKRAERRNDYYGDRI